MKHKPKQAAGILAVCIILSVLWTLAGCTVGGGGRPLLWYAPHSFPFEMTLEASDTAFVLAGERTPEAVTVTVTAPENLAGLTVTYKDGNCVLTMGASAWGETRMPLSAKAAEGLTALLDGLLISSADGAILGSNEDGLITATYDAVILTLDENGLPCAIRSTKTGREAAIRVRSESIAEAN